MPDYENTIQKYIALLEIDKDKNFITPHDAEWRAAQFLRACAHMANYRSIFTTSMIEAESNELLEWNKALKRASGDTITARKIDAQADPEYRKAAEKVTTLRNEIDQFRQLYDLFNNAHIFYRQVSTQIHKESRNGI